MVGKRWEPLFSDFLPLIFYQRTTPSLPSGKLSLPPGDLNLPSGKLSLLSGELNLPSGKLNLPSVKLSLPSDRLSLRPWVHLALRVPGQLLHRAVLERLFHDHEPAWHLMRCNRGNKKRRLGYGLVCKPSIWEGKKH